MIRGARQLHGRFAALERVPETLSKTWAEDTARLAASRVRVRTGETRRSIKVDHAGKDGGAVSVGGAAIFLEGGSAAHDENAKGSAMRFQGRTGTVFAKRVHKPAIGARPFLAKSALEAFEKKSPADVVAEAWNRGG